MVNGFIEYHFREKLTYRKSYDRESAYRNNHWKESLFFLTQAYSLWHESSLVKREVYQTITDYKEAFNFYLKNKIFSMK